MTLTSTGEPGLYEFRTDNIYFFMTKGSQRVRCAVTLKALETLEPNLQRGEATQVACFQRHRGRIEGTASAKFDWHHIEIDGLILVKAEDLL
jgi:hypothetical protein